MQQQKNHEEYQTAQNQLSTPRVNENRPLAVIAKTLKSWFGQAKDDLMPNPAAGAGKEVSYASPIKWGLPAQAASPQAPSPRFADYPQNLWKGDRAKEGMLALRMGDYSSAERFFTARIMEAPSNGTAYRFRALARRGLKDYPGAYSDASKALALNPKDGLAYDVRALVLSDAGHHSQALADANQALLLNPRDADAWRTRGEIHEKMGESDEMLSDFQKAAEIDPQFRELYRQALAGRSANPPSPLSPLVPIRDAAPWLLAGLGFLLAAWWRFRGTDTAMDRAVASAGPAVHNDNAAASSNSPDLDGFRIVRKLGQGGMGEVFEAMDTVLERRVALKKLRSEISSDARERKRFIREARLVAQLQHPNIVQIYTVRDCADGLFLVFELVTGQALDNFMTARNGLSIKSAFKFVSSIGTALDYAHAQGIIHRDLKPANVLVSDEVVKVTDFGIARHVQEALSTLSRNEIIGTPPYMAPEQESGQAMKESDLFSLGVCFYEMVTGELPFSGASSRERKLKHGYELLSQKIPQLPKEVDGVMAKIFEPSPQDRYHYAREFTLDLEKALPRMS